MGLFDGITNTYKKSEAAVVVQNALAHYAAMGLFTMEPAPYATKLINAVWDHKPDIYNGKFGQRPHKITVAITALANGLKVREKDSPVWNVLAMALGVLFKELDANEGFYPLNSLDNELLNEAFTYFVGVSEAG